MSQPVLGILTLYLNDRKVLEERHIYERMITEGRKLGLDVYVFTPADVHAGNGMIHALHYSPEQRKWFRRWRSFPNVIFDRCRIQKSARFRQLVSFRSRYRKLLFLNRPLRNKWTIHKVLHDRREFRQHLPETQLIHGLQDVQRMLARHQTVYLKPINGTGGRGILRVSRRQLLPGIYEIQGRNQSRNIIKPRRVTLSQIGGYLSSWNMRGNYVVQEGIQIELPNGRVHDYRMLVQKNGFGEWEVTGCVGRMGPMHSVTSNLHGGGRAIPMDRLLDKWIPEVQKREEVMQEAYRLGVEIPRFLESQYEALCELALDLAIDRNGRILLLEVNPKPSREVFSQIGDHVSYRKSIVRPLEYALWLYKQKKKSRLDSTDSAAL